MMNKRPELDTKNPPGQIVNRPPAHMEKPLEKNIADFISDSEEMFVDGRTHCKWCICSTGYDKQGNCGERKED